MMVFLHQQLSSRKRRATFESPVAPPKIPKSAATVRPPPPPSQNHIEEASSSVEEMTAILADAGCTLINLSGPPCLPSNRQKFRAHLHRIFSSSDNGEAMRSRFVSAFSSHVQSSNNLRRVLAPLKRDGFGSSVSETLVRHLLLVPSIQLDLQNILLEKLPEYFDTDQENCGTTLSLEDDVARLIINQFRWLDFMVDPNTFVNRLMQILSICPLHLKKEIIGSLPEIIGDQDNKTIVDSLEQMLQEDSSIIVPVLDAFANLNLDEQLQNQVVTMALACIRTINVEHMPYLLRFLLLSETPVNLRRIISQIREQLKFVGISNSRALQHEKLKGKSHAHNTDASILDALRSSLRFKNMLCHEILKEINDLEKPRDHKVIDVWLLILIYTNDESLNKRIEKILKKKIVQSCIQEAMLDHCIRGNREMVQDYFLSFLSLAEYLVPCKEQKARKFGIHIYTCLFEEFTDSYSRQEVLGALVAHVGSGVSSEVSSALDTLALLASRYAQDMIPLYSHINGILDYMEDFGVQNLQKVYGVFSHLLLLARSGADYFGTLVSNELLMTVRKQASHPDMKYKKMGIIGTLKIVCCLGDPNNITCPSSSQKSNCEEALELLGTALDACKQVCLPLILFYDELTATLDSKTLQPSIIEWISKHVGEFESMFLHDLEDGLLVPKVLYCGLEAELWMNLDGDISPIYLNILPLVSSSMQSVSSLQILPANFLLLSAVERLTNQGSLSGIDALLGCPLLLPSSKYFSVAGWQSLTGKQKQIACLALYYAANWIRELLNAFCTQVVGRFQCTSQATKEDTISKLLKRLRNLVFLESLLNSFMKTSPIPLPQLHLHVEHSGSSLSNHKKICNGNSQSSQRKQKNISEASTNSETNGKSRQPTIMEALSKFRAVTSQEATNENSSSKVEKSQSTDNCSLDSNESMFTKISVIDKSLEAQRYKFRPLLVQCLSLLALSEKQDSCCPDPSAELSMHLYLLRDIQYKLDYFTSLATQSFSRCMNASAGFTMMSVNDFFSKIGPIFPSLKSHFENALSILKEGNESNHEHWKVHSVSAGNPDIPDFVISQWEATTLVFQEVLNCFSKMLKLADIQMDETVLSDLLQAFQPLKVSDISFSGIDLSPLPGTIGYCYVGTFSFIDSVMDLACSFSFMLASECLHTLESLLNSIQRFINKLETDGKHKHSTDIQRVLPTLRIRLGVSAQKLLRHNWGSGNLENGWKNKGEMVQKILHIFLENSDSTPDFLEELACSILPQVSSCSATPIDDVDHGFPTLCSATFVAWYRVLHEANLNVLNKLVKEVVRFEKLRVGDQSETVEKYLVKVLKSVNVVVSLVNICRTQDKVTVHAIAVKYGGKFIDSFLKVFDFLQAHFQIHNKSVIQSVQELQKATRTIQALCSAAKGLKQMAITSKIPATKRSLERFLFRVKALLHTTSSGCTFWMGNLKHKDLTGQVVSSQAYVDNQNESPGEEEDDQPASLASEDEQE